MLDILGAMLPDQKETGSRGDGFTRDLHAPPPEGEVAGREGGLTTGCGGQRSGGRKRQQKGGDIGVNWAVGTPTPMTRGAGLGVQDVGRKRAGPDKTGDTTASCSGTTGGEP